MPPALKLFCFPFYWFKFEVFHTCLWNERVDDRTLGPLHYPVVVIHVVHEIFLTLCLQSNGRIGLLDPLGFGLANE